MKADEKELLDRIFAGEPGAFEQLLERYRSLFYSIFNAPGMGFPRDYLDDLFQSFVINLSARDYYKLRATIAAGEAFRPLQEGACPLVSG